ncbi:hypothetical protein [Pseudoalteromonas marina]|uniref:Uncharacterized protein n=2 Tax=Bacteria TaxID=2 RepID=A0ABT9FHY8_9GAMM|nr:hypothetical protein [Pseudoalteromonas marina]MDP2566387.1 hypothetical protein [Pseudoalteromonas marina]
MKTFKLNIKLSSSLEFKLRDKKLKDGKASINNEKITINILYVTQSYSKLEITMNSDVFEFVKSEKDTLTEFLNENGETHSANETTSIVLSAKDIIVNKKDCLASFAICGDELKNIVCNSNAFTQKPVKKKLPTKMNREKARETYQEVLNFTVDETRLLEQEEQIRSTLSKTKTALASQQLSRTMNEDLTDLVTAFSYFLEQCAILKTR